ncbi:MAG: hypothetical protein ACREA9_19000, partial [Pyrinomonadaceae bacterium]
DSVAQTVESVKDTLDWHQQVKKRPITWSLGAAGTGLLVGWAIAAAVKGDGNGGRSASFHQPSVSQPQELASASASTPASNWMVDQGRTNEGPGLVERFKQTQAYDRLRDEAASLGRGFMDEMSRTAHTVLLPAVVGKVKELLHVEDLPNAGAPKI